MSRPGFRWWLMLAVAGALDGFAPAAVKEPYQVAGSSDEREAMLKH